MKKTLAKITLALFAITSIAFFSGCASIDRALYDQKVQTVPAQVTRTNVSYVTNTVTLPASTNSAGLPIPPSIRTITTPVVTYDVAPAMTVTNIVPRSLIENGAQIVAALPIPFAGTAATLLGFLYTGYAAIRNRKLSSALVQGIEAGRKILQETPEGQRLDAKLKDALIHHQEIAGVLNEASKLVNVYTSDTVRA